MTNLGRQLEDLGNPDITAALEEVPVRTFIVDRDGEVRWQNAASVSAIGDWTGRRWVDVPLAEWAAEVREFLVHVVCSGEPADFSFDVREKDGQVTRREISAAPLKDGDTVVGIFGVSTSGSPRRTRAASGHTLLTERQLEVLQLLAEGRSTTQIAAELHLATTTVRNHIANVIASLGVHTRVQAIVAASRAGLIRLP